MEKKSNTEMLYEISSEIKIIDNRVTSIERTLKKLEEHIDRQTDIMWKRIDEHERQLTEIKTTGKVINTAFGILIAVVGVIAIFIK